MIQRSFFANAGVLVFTMVLGACGGGDGGNGGAPTNMPTRYDLIGGSLQGKALTLTGSVSTWAGQIPATNGTGQDVHFAYPAGIATDGTDIYIADTYDHLIRKLALPSGVVTTVAGSGSPGLVDGQGTAASFDSPRGLVVFGSKLYVADTQNNAIRVVDLSSGNASTVAGASDGTAGYQDGAAALFNSPEGLAINADGTMLYVADTHNNSIRQINLSSGDVSTIAGSTAGVSGSANSATDGLSARFFYPVGVTYANSNLYIADSVNNLIRVIDIGTAGNPVSTLAGNGNADFINGPATSASFNFPQGVAVDSITAPTTLYIADSNNNCIRKIDLASGTVSTYSGTGKIGLSDGTLANSSYYFPQALTLINNDVYVADTDSNTIRQITATVVATPAGYSSLNDPNLPGTSALFFYPAAATTDGTNIYIADTSSNSIRQIAISNAGVSTLVGNSAGMNGPLGITTDGAYLYVSDSGNSEIMQVEITSGNVNTLVSASAGLNFPMGITTDGTYLYVVDAGNTVIRKIYKQTGAIVNTFTSSLLTAPQGITYDGTNIYVTDAVNNSIVQVDKVSGAMTAIVSSGLHGPAGITTDGTNLFVTDQNAVYQVNIKSLAMSPLAGSTSAGYSDSPARFSSPMGITTDDNALYITDSGNNTIRLLQ